MGLMPITVMSVTLCEGGARDAPFHPDGLRDHPQLAAVGRITLLQSLRCVRMALWDEKGQRLISFEEAA